MNCEEARPRLADLTAEALKAREAAALRAHLAGCASCRHEMELLERTLTLLPLASRPEPPANLWPRIDAAIQPRPRLRAFRWAPAAVAAFALLVLLWTGLWWRGQQAVAPLETTFVRVALQPENSQAREQVNRYLQQHMAFASYQPFADRTGMLAEPVGEMTRGGR